MKTSHSPHPLLRAPMALALAAAMTLATPAASFATTTSQDESPFVLVDESPYANPVSRHDAGDENVAATHASRALRHAIFDLRIALTGFRQLLSWDIPVSNGMVASME